jgi:hypothetical protein
MDEIEHSRGDSDIHNVFTLNKPTDGAINIVTAGDGYTIQTPFEGSCENG